MLNLSNKQTILTNEQIIFSLTHDNYEENTFFIYLPTSTCVIN